MNLDSLKKGNDSWIVFLGVIPFLIPYLSHRSQKMFSVPPPPTKKRRSKQLSETAGFPFGFSSKHPKSPAPYLSPRFGPFVPFCGVLLPVSVARSRLHQRAGVHRAFEPLGARLEDGAAIHQVQPADAPKQRRVGTVVGVIRVYHVYTDIYIYIIYMYVMYIRIIRATCFKQLLWIEEVWELVLTP